MKDLYDNIAIVHLLDAQDIAAVSTESEILDRADFNGAGIAVNFGAIDVLAAGTDEVLPVLEESDTTEDADFEPVAAGDILGAFTKIDADTEDQATQFVGYIGTKRYIRVAIDVTSATLAHCLVSVDGILAYPGKAPAVGTDPVTAT